MSTQTRAGPSDLERFYADTYPRLVGVLSLASGSQATAEDVVQEAFVRLLPRWKSIQRYDDPEAWVRRVAFRLLSNRRRKARNGVRALIHLTPKADVPEPAVEHLDLVEALQRLSLGHRTVLVLHYLLEMPVESVANELGVPVGTVKSRLNRARSSLLTMLREEDSYA